jgi:hypothetical protein
MTLTAPNAEVLTIEYKINFLSPAQGEQLVARGRVTKPGRTVTVCNADVFAVSAGSEKLVATMLVTIMTVGRQSDVWSPSPAARERSARDQMTAPRWRPCRRLRGATSRLRDSIAR